MPYPIKAPEMKVVDFFNACKTLRLQAEGAQSFGVGIALQHESYGFCQMFNHIVEHKAGDADREQRIYPHPPKK